MGQTISCAAHDCDILVDDQTVMYAMITLTTSVLDIDNALNECITFRFRSLVVDPRVKLKYQQLITNSFVEVRAASNYQKIHNFLALQT